MDEVPTDGWPAGDHARDPAHGRPDALGNPQRGQDPADQWTQPDGIRQVVAPAGRRFDYAIVARPAILSTA
jgi:hypothetical protein